MTESQDTARHMLRHTVATLAYRGGKAIRDAPASFAGFSAREGTRSPVQILAHIGDLLDWALSLAAGERRWHDSEPLCVAPGHWGVTSEPGPDRTGRFGRIDGPSRSMR